ncbi:MAG: hypothetical protein GF383_07165 [Candidatus Lokiarchaeota archaeon]|nr:hypothetical protein [Candidatus Lokiarchaeota archaeon]MBD3339947.1 hypothetical protein [Candidatus Lokiarchaeota archaeon]
MTESTKLKPEQDEKLNHLIEKIYEPNLRNLLKKCYQCARCSGVCQLSKVQKFAPSRIIQKILEGFEDKIIESGVLWDCLMCNSCLSNCPEDINFADIVRMAKYKMVNVAKQNPDKYTAHKGLYLTISEIMSEDFVKPKRNLDWIPEECEIAKEGNILYFVGCLPYFKFEFEHLDTIAPSTLKVLCTIENEPIVVREDENCCGHDLYWGMGDLEGFVKLAKRNYELFNKSKVSTIITTCAEGYRTLKIDYPQIFEDFNEKFEIKHIIEYVFEQWKNQKITFKKPEKTTDLIPITFHDPCRLSRFLPKENNIMENVRLILKNLENLGYLFEEMEHNKGDSLCCGVSCWMNCNERSKALRYKRLMEAKNVASKLITSCPKCEMHFTCLKDDMDEFEELDIVDFSEFIIDLIEIKEDNTKKEEKI